MNLAMLVYPSVLFFVFIFLPSFWVFFHASDDLSALVFKIAASGMVVFALFSFLVYFNIGKNKSILTRKAVDKLMFWLFVGFVCSYVYLIFDYKGLPVFEYLINGGVPNKLRSEFYKDKEGMVQVAVYLRSVLTKGFIPLYAVYSFVFYKKKNFILVFLTYLFFSLTTFEKSAILWFVLPLVVYFLYSKRYKLLVVYIFLAAFSIALLGFLQQSESSGAESTTSGFRDSFRVTDSLHNVESYQFIFSDIANKKTLPFMLDRIFWIPFVTFYDTLYYWTVAHDDYLYLSSNRHLAKLAGIPFANVERNVFIFQFGGGEGTTGNSNASYIAEAYLMFGFLGVVLFSALLGFINGYVVSSGNWILISAFSVYPYAVILSASFLSMMFSGGLLLYIILFNILTVRYKL